MKSIFPCVTSKDIILRFHKLYIFRIMYILSLDIFIKNIADISVLRLKESEELKHNYVGHCAILTGIGSSNWIQMTNYL